jgi:hypothetical protein
MSRGLSDPLSDGIALAALRGQSRWWKPNFWQCGQRATRSPLSSSGSGWTPNGCGPGPVFGPASVAGLLVTGTGGRRLALAVVGIVGVAMFLPATVIHFFAGTHGGPVLILLAGVVLLAITLVMLRWRRPWPQAMAPTPAKERPEER